MNAVLSRAEIEARFADEWVLIGEPQTDASLDILGGQVLHHSKDRDEVYQKATELRPKRFAVLFLGTPPSDMAFAL